MVDADRALWDFNPILASRYVSDDRAVTGKYYEISPDRAFTGMVQLLKDYVARRSVWIDKALLTDKAMPDTPSLSYAGPAGYPADQLLMHASGFRDPQGSDTFGAMQWRAAEIIRPGLPGYTENSRWRYEMESTWLSPQLTTYQADMVVPRGACRPGITVPSPRARHGQQRPLESLVGACRVCRGLTHIGTEQGSQNQRDHVQAGAA